KAHEVVFEYKLEGEAFSCERLKNGNTLVGCCSAGELVEVDPGGNVVKTIPLTADAGGHGLMRLGRATPWGTYLVAHTGDKMVREYDASGAVIREIKAPDLAFGVVPLANKNILISTETAIIEVTPDDKEVWRLTGADIPEAGAAWLTGMRRLKNGNTLVCNWLGHGKEGTGVPLFEITPDKKIVWQFTDTEQTKWIASAQYVPAKDAE
ncbi:MAG: esterase-like activity of phytase family protein, partial [bacterium]|nr:esterase-like activity of phytase family protein [bacterium]